MADETVPAGVAAQAFDLIERARRPPPPLGVALGVVVDALASAPEPARAELRSLLPLLIDTGSPLYRQRLAELLAGGAA